MKIFLIVFCIGFYFYSVSGQAPALISSGGNVYIAAGVALQWSIGEPVISTHLNEPNSISQGFHQPNLLPCDGDFDWNGVVNTNDLLLLTSEYGCILDCFSDLTGDGVTNTQDLLVFLSAFGGSCTIP